MHRTVLPFEPARRAAADRRLATATALAHHRMRRAMLDIGWRLRQAINGEPEEQDPKAIETLQHTAALLLKIPRAKPLKAITRLRASPLARAVLLICGL